MNVIFFLIHLYINYVPIEIGCTTSHECPAEKACIDFVCLDPCSVANPCLPDQECQMIEHEPICKQSKYGKLKFKIFKLII